MLGGTDEELVKSNQAELRLVGEQQQWQVRLLALFHDANAVGFVMRGILNGCCVASMWGCNGRRHLCT